MLNSLGLILQVAINVSDALSSIDVSTMSMKLSPEYRIFWAIRGSLPIKLNCLPVRITGEVMAAPHKSI